MLKQTLADIRYYEAHVEMIRKKADALEAVVTILSNYYNHNFDEERLHNLVSEEEKAKNSMSLTPQVSLRVNPQSINFTYWLTKFSEVAPLLRELGTHGYRQENRPFINKEKGVASYDLQTVEQEAVRCVPIYLEAHLILEGPYSRCKRVKVGTREIEVFETSCKGEELAV